MKLSFSVAIPTYNRPQVLRDTLISILESTRKPNEVLVIDDGTLPNDFLSEMDKLFVAQKIPFLYKNKNQSGLRRGLSESKNWTTELVSSDIICFLDDDVVIKPEYFSELMQVWESNAADKKLIGIGGKVVNARSISVLEKIFRKIFGLSSKYKWDVNEVGFQVWDRSVANVERAYYMEGCSSSYRRDILRTMPFAVFAGGRTSLEDVEHCLRSKKSGYHFLYAPNAQLVHHQAPIGRDTAFLSGWKEGHNRRYIFRANVTRDAYHVLWFIWANIGWILKKMLVFKFREAFGMVAGLFSSAPPAKAVNKTDLIKDHTVDIYGSSPSVAEAVRSLNPRKVTLFMRNTGSEQIHKDIVIRELSASSAASLTVADVCMLDGDSLKVLAVRYPSDAQYVLARFAIRSGWLLGILGLTRRLVLGRLKLGGIIRLRDAKNCSSYWLIIHRTKKTTKQERLFLPKSIGVITFFEWLRSERIQYVVPRFYEQLPELHREGGDLDLLAVNEDVEKIKDYLRSHADKFSGTNADSIPIGMHSVSRSAGIPYFPPPLARRIIDRAVDGPAGSRIPAPDDALHALIYHVLYHGKGYATNIRSTQNGKPENPSENDYGLLIKQKATALHIDVGETMEDMDDYMARVEWRPKRDTLAKIAEKNAWVRDRFFSNTNQGGTGLTVFILKEFVLERELMNDIVSHLRDDGLTIVRAVVLSDEQKQRAAEHIRGGNWVGPQGHAKGLLPAAIIIAVDPQCVNLPPAYAGEYERMWSKRRKHNVRSKFDKVGEASLVHAADNTREAWEYIQACFPDEIDTVKQEIEREAHAPLSARIRRIFSLTYIKHTAMFTIRDFVTRRL